MKKRPKILVVGSLMMNQGIETSVIPEEGQTVMGEDIKKSPGGSTDGSPWGRCYADR